MDSPFHPGELAVQQRAGVQQTAGRVAGSIRDQIPDSAAAFLMERRFVVLAALGSDGRPWASILTGAPGFASAPDSRTVRLGTSLSDGDPLAGALEAGGLVGLLALDPSKRRRMRVNGRLMPAERGLEIRVDQVYSNCPKYIQRRSGEDAAAPTVPRVISRAAALTEAQRDWIRRADTFFIASVAPGQGADASHRGGMPGFVLVRENRLVWPDYAGNSLFNTLGNIAAYPRAGLAIPDFESGGLLQLTGRAEIDWDPAHAAAVPGAERLVALEVEEVVELAAALPPALRLLEYSPVNPPAAPPAANPAGTRGAAR